MVDVYLSLPPGCFVGGSISTIVDAARRAEDAGFDGVVVPDHVLMGPNTHEYPWGTFPMPDASDWLEPIVVLSHIGAVTTRLKLGTGILIAPLRPAALLAKQIATLDGLAGPGRIELGVGTGWLRDEFEAEGLSFVDRGQLLTDTVAACRALWSSAPVSFTSSSVAFSEVRSDPQPAVMPTVLFAGTLTARNIRRITEHGDGWIPIMGERTEEVRRGIAFLRERFAAAGRDPSALRVRASLPVVCRDTGPDFAASAAGVDELAEMGATAVTVPLASFVREEAELASWIGAAGSIVAAHR